MRRTQEWFASGLLVLGSGALLSSCSDSGSAVEVLAKAAAMPGADLRPHASLATSETELADAWARYGFEGEPTISLDEGPVLFVAAVESSSCPLTVEYVGPLPADLDVDADALVRLGMSGEPECTSDANPVSFVVRADDIAGAASVFIQFVPATSAIGRRIALDS